MVDPSLFTGRYDDSLCAALARRGHAVSLLGRRLRASDAIVPVGYAYRPHFFRMGERVRDLLGDNALSRVTKALEYGLYAGMGSLRTLTGDVVHVQWLPFALADRRLLDRLRPRTALVHTVHNAQPFHGDRKGAGRGASYRKLLARFDALIVHGEGTRDALLAQGMADDHIHVVPHPPMRLASASAADVAAVPAPRAVRLLFFGTIRPYKGLDLLMAACLTLWRAGLDFELAIAGKPFMSIEPLLASVRAAGFGHRLILDLGFLAEGRLDAHLRQADIIAFPYRSIDSSGAFLSALGYDAAMVTSDAGMFAALASGVAARFPAGDASALADALRPLIADPARRQAGASAARDWLARQAGWDAAAQASEQVYAVARERFARRSTRK